MPFSTYINYTLPESFSVDGTFNVSGDNVTYVLTYFDATYLDGTIEGATVSVENATDGMPQLVVSNPKAT